MVLMNCTASFAMASPSQTTHGMVVTGQHLASQIGVDILKSGGNAIDAAVAVGYALAVVDPCCGNIGGGGFMTLHLANGKNIFINFRERAPLAATANLFQDKNGNIIPTKSTLGYSAVATPGTVLGLDSVLQKYGTLTRKQVMTPAIQLAKTGFILDPGDIKLLKMQTADFKTVPNVAAIFLKKGRPYRVGERLTQPDLANTLQLIANQGPDVFYKGVIAEKIVKASTANGGILTMKDFENYAIEEMQPLECHYHADTVISAPPPSSGGTTLCEILNVLEGYPLPTWGYHSAKSTSAIVEAMRQAFYDRNNKLGDPDFVSNPVQQLISKEYAAEIRRHITQNITHHSGVILQEGMNTTHYSIMDGKGNAVSVTYTLNSLFGAKVIAENTGFFLNNEMDDFTAKLGVSNQFGLVGGEKNTIQPGKRPLSSMTPTIVMRNNHVILIAGSSGGPRIITATLLTLLNTLDYHMNIQAAVDAPRFHHQWMPDVIDAEPDAFSAHTKDELINMGYHISESPFWGIVEAIYVDPTTHVMYGGSDKRRASGQAIGY
jgi:gamma-glutamyltranspeptidase/glutathione hydrolase